MKTSAILIFWFLVTFFVISVLTSVSAADVVKQPSPPPAECTCGVCD